MSRRDPRAPPQTKAGSLPRDAVSLLQIAREAEAPLAGIQNCLPSEFNLRLSKALKASRTAWAPPLVIASQ
jgi:hypothetical protein